MKKHYLLILSLLGALSIYSQVRLPDVISSNMVLQAEKPVTIWGNARPFETITVTFASQSRVAVADNHGRWQVTLESMNPSAESRKMIISASNTIVLDNILVGEVWLCSGQSNMEYPMDRKLKKYSLPARGEDLSAVELNNKNRNPYLRFLYVDKRLAPPLSANGWKVSNDSSLSRVSATAYFFAKSLADSLHIPVGIISSSWGGTRVEEWTPEFAYRESSFNKDSAFVKNESKIDGMQPGKKFDTMIKALIPYTMKGILWYQGESNCMIHDTATFEFKTRLMLASWKWLWNDESLRFYFVQIAPYAYSRRKDKLSHPVDLLPHYWEIQNRLLTLPYSGMVVTTDLVDDLNNIHPSYKWEVGRRLSLISLARDYNLPIVYSGPRYKSMLKKRRHIEIEFSDVADGLKSSDGMELTGFSIAGPDRVFYLANAFIRDNKVLVSSDRVKKPVAVRFAWEESVMSNFCNASNLPATAFRTDNW